MEEKPLSDEIDEVERTVKLLADLRTMHGSVCKRCAAAICHHEALLSLTMGFKDAPRCCHCLAVEFERDPVQMRDGAWSFILHRTCHRAGWAWANREEGYQPGALPGCLWPYPRKASERSAENKTVEKMDDSSESDDWDAGSMACGDLVLELRLRLKKMKPGRVLKIMATDSGAREDIPAWCRMTGHVLLSADHPQYWIQRKED
jgi:tRNA 2-thiouridine synthesizing protein A